MSVMTRVLGLMGLRTATPAPTPQVPRRKAAAKRGGKVRRRPVKRAKRVGRRK